MLTMGNARSDDDPDVRLMLDVQADVPQAFEALVARHSASLVAFLDRHVGNVDDAEDLAQEVFARVYRARGRYVPTARFRTWLWTIATNVTKNHQRYWKQRPSMHLSSVPEPEGIRPSDSDGASDPARDAERQEVCQRVRDALMRLPEKQRLAVNLLRYEGLGYGDIASVLDLSVQAVKSLLNRAKENLREALLRDIKDYLSEQESKVAGEW